MIPNQEVLRALNSKRITSVEGEKLMVVFGRPWVTFSDGIGTHDASESLSKAGMKQAISCIAQLQGTSKRLNIITKTIIEKNIVKMIAGNATSGEFLNGEAVVIMAIVGRAD